MCIERWSILLSQYRPITIYQKNGDNKLDDRSFKNLLIKTDQDLKKHINLFTHFISEQESSYYNELVPISYSSLWSSHTHTEYDSDAEEHRTK